MQPVDIIFGGQFGSEGKGVIAGHIASDYDYHVRVGAPNAGHSLIGPDGKLWKMQTVPCGWVNPKATLIIGRGGLIDPVLLRKELEAIYEVDPTIYQRIIIDPKCGILNARFHKMEGGIDGEMHKRIGSTGEGVGPAREARISRNPKLFRFFIDLRHEDSYFAAIPSIDTTAVLEMAMNAGKRILLEGAQGQGLSLIHGPWPYCTSTDPGPAQLCADVGIPMTAVGRIIACMRTHPIRVAGNSGPLANEITWAQISSIMGRDMEERTTVTKKVRRIAKWDDVIANQCRRLHGPTEIALTFVDYLDVKDEGVTSYDDLTQYSKDFIGHVEQVMECPVTFIGTGGKKLRVIRRS